MVVATRITFALSRDKTLPGSSVLGAVNANTHTPIASIVLVAAVGIGINLLSAGIAANVVSICSVAYYFIYPSDSRWRPLRSPEGKDARASYG